jgi:hypothetical protein
MRAALLLVLAMNLTVPAVAQTASPDTTRTYRHSLSLTASPRLNHFFTANRALPVGLLYKQQIRPGQALRIRIVGSYSRYDSLFQDTDFPDQLTGYLQGPNTRQWQIAAFVGYERSYLLAKHLQGSYGLEAGGE